MRSNLDNLWNIKQSYEFLLDVQPQVKQSTQFGSFRAFTPAKKRQYQALVSRLLEDQFSGEKLCGPIKVTAVFSFPFRIEDRLYKQLGWMPMVEMKDIDNLLKPALDALSTIVYHDDCTVVDLHAVKIRSSKAVIYLCVEQVLANYNSKLLQDLLKLE